MPIEYTHVSITRCMWCHGYYASGTNHQCPSDYDVRWHWTWHQERKAAQEPMPTGWLCPRCGRVNAPSEKQCSCPISKE